MQLFFGNPFLLRHCKSILNFYNPNLIDDDGGYHQNYYDNGDIFDSSHKQLVSSTRIVVNYARAAHILNKPQYLAVAQHGLDYIENVHWQPKTRGYAWTLINHQADDMTQQAYGYAFVLLAYAAARQSGIIDNNDKLLATYKLLEKRFWQDDYGLYADTIQVDGKLSTYRGQNANMHLCEAMIASFNATQEPVFLERAILLAKNICHRQADLTNGLVWEHYTTDFMPDWNYNKRDPKNLYRPWGFQPGHQTEWAKLLLQLNSIAPNHWLVEKAQFLFDKSFNIAWDEQYGGIVYGFNPKGKWCDEDKYFWVQAESIAAAAALYQTTGIEKYLEQYNIMWNYVWNHFVDHKYGAWYRVLNRNNNKYSNHKSLAGAKCDYHTLGACFDIINVKQ